MSDHGVPNPLIPLHATDSHDLPIVCVPGAGASVTAFMGLIDAIGGAWPVYGLQPLGLDLAHSPHTNVEVAAAYNLDALVAAGVKKPLHLVGHSYGGWVAFEMAICLQQRGHHVASLTIIDSEPPDILGSGVREATDAQIYREFVEVFEKSFDVSLNIDMTIMDGGNETLFIRCMHAALVKAKAVPGRSQPDMLRGSLSTFSAARRAIYIPSHRYIGRTNLALVSELQASFEEDMLRRKDYAAKWKGHVDELHVWHGPGHHFSILRQPHVDALAKWWEKNRSALSVKSASPIEQRNYYS